MRCLVIHAHPNPESFSAALRDATVTGLRSGGHDVDVVDLYAMGYRAKMTDQEHRDYYTIASDHPDPQVASHIDLVQQADALVFVYPTWWSGFPAIMKAWLDRTMLPDVSFIKNDDTGKIKPNLGNIRHLVSVTTSGASPLMMRVVGDAGRRTVHRTLRLACHWRCKSHRFALASIDATTPEERTEFLSKVSSAMGEL